MIEEGTMLPTIMRGNKVSNVKFFKDHHQNFKSGADVQIEAIGNNSTCIGQFIAAPNSLET